MTKYKIGKITLARGVKKLVIGSNRTWKLRQINLVQVNLEAHDKLQEYKYMTTMQMDIYFDYFKWYLKSYTSGVIPTYEVVSIKNARFKCQLSTPMKSFVSRDAHLLWKLMTKEERLVQRYWGKLDLDMDMDKEGATY